MSGTRNLVPALALLMTFALLPEAGAQGAGEANPWRITLSDELAVEHYAVDGDESASPFRFAGTFWTNRLILGLRRDVVGRKFVLDLEALVADNDYLADDGAVLELLRVEFEDGTRGVPYRLGVGDVYTDFSRRTLQRNIRGGSLELQPRWGGADQSILFVSGSGERGWNGTFGEDPEKLFFTGASYLLSSRSGRTLVVANLVNAQQTTLDGLPPAGSAGAEDAARVGNDHTVGSVYAETRIGPWHLEAEVARFSGERGAGGAGDVDDRSFYGQVAQSGGPLSWRLRYEENGENFLPVGAVGIIANRRIGELHARTRLGRAGTLRGRVQLVENAFEGDAPSRSSDLFGMSWDGRPLRRRPGLRLRFSADLNDSRSDDDRLDQRFGSLSLDVADRLGRSLAWSYRVTARDVDDRSATDADVTTLDHDVSIGRPFATALAGHRVDLDLRGGFVYRAQNGASEFDSWSPVVDVSARSGLHRLALHLGFLEQSFVRDVIEDLQYRTRRFSYSYLNGPHELRFELGQEIRRPDRAEETDSLRVAVRYRLALDFGAAGGAP